MAQPGDEDERRPPDPDGADTGDARSAGAEAQGLTWSEIAELDEVADGAGDPFAGTEESTGERNFGDGGLLGVDSGLLRVLDDEGPALPPDPGEDPALPSDPDQAAPTISGGLKLDDAAGALPDDLNLDAPPPAEDDDFDVAGFLAEAADDAADAPLEDDGPLDVSGASPDEADGAPASRKSIWSFSEEDFEVDEDEEDGEEGQLDNYVDDIMTDLAVDQLDAGGDWAEAVVGDVAMSEAETGWGDIEVSEEALEDEAEEPPKEALFAEPDEEDDEPLDLPDDLEREPDAVFAVTEEEMEAPGPAPAPRPIAAPAEVPKPSIALDETVTSTAAWQPPAPEPAPPPPEPAPLAAGMHDPFAARTSDGLADEFDAVAGAEIQSEDGGGWSFDEVMPDPDVVSVPPRSRAAGLAWDVGGDDAGGGEPVLDADPGGADLGDAAFPFEVDEAQVIDASELAVAETVAEMPALAPPTVREGRPTPDAVEAARALMAERSARRMEALAQGREDAVVVENVLYDDGGRLVVQYESPTFDELEVDALDLVEDESLLDAEPEVEDEEVEAILEGSGLIDIDGPAPMVIEVEAEDVVDAFDASEDDDASVLERLSREPLRLAPPGPAPQPEGGAREVPPVADPMVVPVDVQAPAEAGEVDFGAELALDLKIEGAEALAAEPTADMVPDTGDPYAHPEAGALAPDAPDAAEPPTVSAPVPVETPRPDAPAAEQAPASIVPLLTPPERSPDASYEAADFDDPGDVPQPSWHGALEDVGGSVELPAHTETFGVPFLGSVPSFEGPRGLTGFPAGSLAAVDLVPAAGPPVLPVLPRPALGEEDPRATALLARLLSEIEVEVDRRRLALLLHEVGRIATGDAGDPDLALAALQAAQSVDPDFELNRWTLHRMLLDAGRVEDVVAHLARLAGRGEGGALHRAGHLARVGLRDPDRAAALWQRATEVESAPLSAHLAHYTLRLSQLDWEQAERALEPAIEAARGATLRGVLELDRIRLTEELGGNPDTLHARYEAALEHLGGSAAMLAAVERHVVERGGHELLLQALRARFDTVMADFNDGHLKEDEAKREVAEVFFKAAWALEKLGRRSEALREYQNALRTWPGDPYLLHRAAELAWSLGMPDEHRAILDRMAQDAGAPPDAANAMYQRGLIAQSVLGDDREAARDFERALGMMPTFTPALAALGRLSIRQGRWDEVHARYAAEIAQLEESLKTTSDADARQRTIRGLVSRYYRVARLLELRMGDEDAAVAFDKRALGLDPLFMPAFHALEASCERQGRWRELASLYLGLVSRLPAERDPLPFLLRAAEIFAVQLQDPVNAGRTYARVLQQRPDHPYALRRAGEVFDRAGFRAAQVEVEALRGRDHADAILGATHIVRAGVLQEGDGDPRVAAAEALELFREALGSAPALPSALDGVWRAAVRLGRPGAIAQALAQPVKDGATVPEIVLAGSADAFVAAERFDEARDVLRAWQEATPQPAATSLQLMALVHERGGAWSDLVDVLEQLAAREEHPTRRAGLLARVGELWEFRLDDPELAGDAYQRALNVDPECAAAAEGRLRGSVGQRTIPPVSSLAGELIGDLRTEAARAVAMGDTHRKRALLRRMEEAAQDPDEARALAFIRNPEATDRPTLRALVDANPGRRDLFEAWERRLEDNAADDAERIEVMRARVPHEDAHGQPALLAELLGRCEDAGDEAGTEWAARALLDLEPDSLRGVMALRRLAARTGEVQTWIDASERLAGMLRAPGRAARIYRELARVTERQGVEPERARALLEKALELDPSDPRAGDALADRLEAAGRWDDLLELLNRRIVATDAPAHLEALLRRKADLLDQRLGDEVGALGALRELLRLKPQDAPALLRAGLLAARHGQDDALSLLGRAVEAGTGEVRANASLAEASLRRDAGDAPGARVALERALADGDRVDALEMLAELDARGQRWPQLLATMERLYGAEATDEKKADRAIAVAELRARLLRDALGATRWLGRALDHRPGHLATTERLLAEIERVPGDAQTAVLIRDALDHAASGARARLADDAVDPEAIRLLARLHQRRGDRDGYFRAAQVLEYLKIADDVELGFVEARRSDDGPVFDRALDADLRQRLMAHPGERTFTGALLAPFALILSELLSDRPPTGCTRLSARSFGEWQHGFRRLSRALMMDDVTLWQTAQPAEALDGYYLPDPAIVVGVGTLERAVDAFACARVGSLLEGARGGRLLLERPGVRAVSACVAVMSEAVAPGLVEAGAPAESDLPERFVARVRARAEQLPRRIKLQLETLRDVHAAGSRVIDYGMLAEAARRTRHRAALLVSGEVSAAVDLIWAGRDLTAARRGLGADEIAHNLRDSEAALDLVRYALSDEYGVLRDALGVAVTR